jgi:cob(I)alamin adenosyltransferase
MGRAQGSLAGLPRWRRIVFGMAVNLTRIYTKLGDAGETHLGDMSRVPKTDPRIEAFGAIDELNAQIGMVLATAAVPDPYSEWLRQIQNDLFDVGADLAKPPRSRKPSDLRIDAGYVDRLERACDLANERLEPLRSFLLPGGSPVAAQLHICRTVCRRAERRALAVEDVNPEVLRYLNRLSDLLFILSRTTNTEDEPLWRPGGRAT